MLKLETGFIWLACNKSLSFEVPVYSQWYVDAMQCSCYKNLSFEQQMGLTS
jgi:hypothetical protein